MTATLEEPVRVADKAAPLVYYTFRRVAHNFGHLHCCVIALKAAGSCMNDPFNDDQKPKGAKANRQEDPMCVKADLIGAWKRLKGMEQKVVRGIITIGPRERMEHDDEWYDRRLIWWILHRHEFGNFSAEALMNMADDAISAMVRDLNRKQFPPITDNPIDN